MKRAVAITAAALITAGGAYLSLSPPPPPPPIIIDIASLTLSPPQPGEWFKTYFQVSAVSNNFVHGSWGNRGIANHIDIGWIGNAGVNYVIESATIGEGQNPTIEQCNSSTQCVNGTRLGESWNPCSLIITGHAGPMSWASGVPGGATVERFFRIRQL